MGTSRLPAPGQVWAAVWVPGIWWYEWITLPPPRWFKFPPLRIKRVWLECSPELLFFFVYNIWMFGLQCSTHLESTGHLLMLSFLMSSCQNLPDRSSQWLSDPEHRRQYPDHHQHAAARKHSTDRPRSEPFISLKQRGDYCRRSQISRVGMLAMGVALHLPLSAHPPLPLQSSPAGPWTPSCWGQCTRTVAFHHWVSSQCGPDKQGDPCATLPTFFSFFFFMLKLYFWNNTAAWVDGLFWKIKDKSDIKNTTI